MAETHFPSFVPPSLIRIRCFLNRQGMKIKPWLGPDAVLESFYATLRAQEKSDDFWQQLRELLRNLADDMNHRVLARGWVIDNELLDQSCHQSLLEEIRSALGGGRVDGKLQTFALALSRRAGTLLLMLAAATAIGCGGELDSAGGEAPGGGASHSGTSSHGGSSAQAGGASARSDTFVISPTTGGTSAQSSSGSNGQGTGGTSSSNNSNASGGASATSDAYPCPDPGVSSGLDPAQFESCDQKLVAALIPYHFPGLLECVCLLNDSWQTGLADLFAGQDCGQIASYFDCCGYSYGYKHFCNRTNELPAEFEPSYLSSLSCCPIYLGVRCD
jgi:hypothetical protein